MTKKIVDLWKEMADLTIPKCKECPNPMSCCSPEYCEMAIEIAEKDGVKLQVTDHKTLPLMSKDGCICPPHYRPLCTLHVCSINGAGFDLKDPEWTKEYFKLREEIIELTN